jgi:predicted HD phosphohydrolase
MIGRPKVGPTQPKRWPPTATHIELRTAGVPRGCGPDRPHGALHVAAKRFLVSTEPGYAAGLSDASVRTLRLQGGPMSPREVAEFEGLDHSREALALRRIDEAAKDGSKRALDFASQRELLVRVLHREAVRRSLV